MLRKLIPLLLVVSLASCGDKESPKVAIEKAAPNLTKTVDVGKVEQIDTATQGFGISPGAAINEALKTAIMQVNGTSINATSANFNSYQNVTAKIDLETSEGKDSASVNAAFQGQAFAEAIISQSNGIVTSFKVVSITPPKEKGQTYTVNIESKIAKFNGPVDSKIKIVVPSLTSERASFNIGGREVPAKEILEPIRQQMINVLTESGRFTVLDRQFDAQREAEFDRIRGGGSNKSDIAKLGQELSADLVWMGRVNDFAYEKHVRKLQTSDRDLVSFSGGWSVSQRMINLTTSGIALSSTIQAKLPSVAPTTLGAQFDETSIKNAMQQEFVKRTTDAIVLKMFPISVIKIDGTNVKLSQGGNSVKESARYKVYMLGEEMFDPQTKESLGNDEKYCCDVSITRVQPKFSEGVLENVKISLDGIKPISLYTSPLSLKLA